MKWPWYQALQMHPRYLMPSNDQTDPKRWAAPSLTRRMAAIFYDSILVIALLLTAITLVIVPLDLIMGWDNVDKEELRTHPLYLTYLFCVMAGFHILFWIRGGQTLGMRAWRLRVVRNDGGSLTFKDALVRYLAAILSLLALGLGFLWVLVDPDKLSWHDRISKTRLVIVKKKSNTTTHSAPG